MAGTWKKAITVLLLMAVVYVVVSPALDLDPSANRAQRAALQVMLVIAMFGTLLCGYQAPTLRLDGFAATFDLRGSPTLSSIVSRC